jgi:hypothetical protein
VVLVGGHEEWHKPRAFPRRLALKVAGGHLKLVKAQLPAVADLARLVEFIDWELVDYYQGRLQNVLALELGALGVPDVASEPLPDPIKDSALPRARLPHKGQGPLLAYPVGVVKHKLEGGVPESNKNGRSQDKGNDKRIEQAHAAHRVNLVLEEDAGVRVDVNLSASTSSGVYVPVHYLLELGLHKVNHVPGRGLVKELLGNAHVNGAVVHGVVGQTPNENLALSLSHPPLEAFLDTEEVRGLGNLSHSSLSQ